MVKKGMKGIHHSDKTKRILSKKAKLRLGEKASNWKGGRMIVDGYIYIYSPSHPHRTKDKYVTEHRLIMEKHLGRILLPTEVVHHINGNKLDNRIENLMLFSSPGQHTSVVHIKKRDKYGKFTNIETDEPPQKNGKIVACPMCNKNFYVQPRFIGSNNFCSKKCYLKWRWNYDSD